MKRNLLIAFTAFLVVSCGSEKKEETKESESKENSGSSEGEGPIEESVPFTEENILGQWTVVEYSSDVEGSQEMVGKVFEFRADSVSLSYPTEEGILSPTCFYELIDEQTIKITLELEKATMYPIYHGFIQGNTIGNTMRLNTSSGNILLKK